MTIDKAAPYWCADMVSRLLTNYQVQARARANPVLMESGFALLLFMWSHFFDGEPVATAGSSPGSSPGMPRLKMLQVAQTRQAPVAALHFTGGPAPLR